MSRARDLADLGNNASNTETATNQITDSSTDLNVDSNTLVVDKSANRVGIGRTDPQTTLDIAHSGSSNSGAVRIGDPSAISSNTSIYMRTTGDGVIGTGGGDIVFDTNIGSAERMRIESSGNFIFNENSNDADFRVESNGNSHALFVEGGTDRVSINSSSPTRDFYVNGDSYLGGFNFLNPVTAYRITSGTATRNVKLHSTNGGECWGKLTLVGLWPYTGAGFGTVTVEFAGYMSEGRVSVIDTVKNGGGSSVTVTVTGDDANDLINFQITTTATGWRFAAFCELIYGNKQAYLSIDGTDG